MSPEDRKQFDELKRKVAALESATNIQFIGNIKRYALNESVTSDATGSNSGLSTSVRNAADSGSEDVAKAYDKSVRLYLLNGQSILVGGYN